MIQKTEGVCGGSARIRDTRIAVWVIVAHKRLGMNDLQILQYYPGLSPDDIAAVWEYYSLNQSEIEQEILDNVEETS